MKKITLTLAIIFSLMSFSGQSLAWYDKTHLAVAKVAGYDAWYNAAGADIAKIKAGDRERNNHFYNNNSKEEITVQMVLDQVARYNKADGLEDAEGHLYGAIIGALRDYEKNSALGKYGEYHLAYCAHYIGNLSMPLHNTPYDDFNERRPRYKRRHCREDYSRSTAENCQVICTKLICGMISFEADLAREIARIANLSRKLGYKLAKEDRDMTPEEAYMQLGHSASLLKAVLRHYKKI